MNNSLIVDDLNIAELSDDELLERLRTYGFNAGPIIGSTREVYQRKLARLMRDEDYDDLGDDDNDDKYPEMNMSYDSTYLGSPTISVEELRRRPLSRVANESWSTSPLLSPNKPWSPDDIVSQVQPPEGEEKPLVSVRLVAVAVIGFLFFALIVFYNMESTPPTPFP